MDYSEKWGKDVDEAVRLALEDLGLTEDQVMVTVLEEPSKGFLGLGSKLAKVRVEKIVVEEEEKEAGAANGKESKKANRDLRKKSRPQTAGRSGAPSGGRGGNDGGSRGNAGGARKERGGSGRNENERNAGNAGKTGNERRGGGVRQVSFENHEEFDDFNFSDKPLLSERPENLKEIEDNEASLFLKDIIAKMRLDATVKTFINDECTFVEVSGPDSKTVIGKRGQTLDSIQYLTNLVANKDKETYQRVIIDVEGYRSRREKTLERLAVKLARKVQKSGRNVRLEPMNPYERKVIHSTLQTFDGVSTRSEGEEPYRRVIIEKK